MKSCGVGPSFGCKSPVSTFVAKARFQLLLQKPGFNFRLQKPGFGHENTYQYHGMNQKELAIARAPSHPLETLAASRGAELIRKTNRQ